MSAHERSPFGRTLVWSFKWGLLANEGHKRSKYLDFGIVTHTKPIGWNRERWRWVSGPILLQECFVSKRTRFVTYCTGRVSQTEFSHCQVGLVCPWSVHIHMTALAEQTGELGQLHLESTLLTDTTTPACWQNWFISVQFRDDTGNVETWRWTAERTGWVKK